jgi:hypothetical protein
VKHGFDDLNIFVLKQTFRRLKSFLGSDSVLADGDKFLGPVRDIGPVARRDWLHTHFGARIHENEIAAAENAYKKLREIQHDYARRIVWVDLGSAPEFANFLWYVGRCKPKDFLIATPAVLGPQFICPDRASVAEAVKLIRESATLVRREQLQEYHTLYEKLNSENAAFRLFDEHGQFRSYDLDAFDTLLLSCTEREWEPMARVLLRAIEHCYDSGRSMPGDLIFCHRLVWLAHNTKRVELRGDASDPIRGEIRSLG